MLADELLGRVRRRNNSLLLVSVAVGNPLKLLQLHIIHLKNGVSLILAVKGFLRIRDNTWEGPSTQQALQRWWLLFLTNFLSFFFFLHFSKNMKQNLTYPCHKVEFWKTGIPETHFKWRPKENCKVSEHKHWQVSVSSSSLEQSSGKRFQYCKGDLPRVSTVWLFTLYTVQRQLAREVSGAGMEPTLLSWNHVQMCVCTDACPSVICTNASYSPYLALLKYIIFSK